MRNKFGLVQFVLSFRQRRGPASRTLLVLTQDVSVFPIVIFPAPSIFPRITSSQRKRESSRVREKARARALEIFGYVSVHSNRDARSDSKLSLNRRTGLSWKLHDYQCDIQILLRPQEYRTGDFFSCCCVVLTVASLRQIFFLLPAAELAAQQIVANISPYFYRPILLPSNSSVGYRFGILESFVIEKSLAGKNRAPSNHLVPFWCQSLLSYAIFFFSFVFS